MKVRSKVLCVAAAALLAAVVPAFADLSGQATAHVRVLVNPNVGIAAVNPTIDAGSVQTGDFTASIDFRVDANKQEVSFQVDASPLFKGNDPTQTIVNPIPLNLTAGVLIQPINGNATGGHSNMAKYTGTTGPIIQGFPTTPTEVVQFSSSQNNHFSQNVNVKVTWTQGDPELPTGEYSGVVQVTALLLPE
jgi:hypothetical protein